MTVSDINAEVRSLCDTDSTGYTAADLLRRVNSAYEETVGLIIGLDGTWQFDDTNYTSFPIGTTDLVASQHDYSFDTTFLKIEKVAIKDLDGKYRFINPVDKNEFPDPLETLFPDAGQPIYYDKQGGSVLIYPKPTATYVTLTAGLKVYFQRTADVFTSAQVITGTKVPGFATPFHMLICYKAAIPYCMSYKKDRVALYEKKVDDLTKDLIAFYGKREKDVPKRMDVAGINYI